MVDVFVSYARDERALAEPIFRALVELGVVAFFDIEGGIDAGAEFPDVIDRAVRKAKAVLGLWSDLALSRRWVKIECGIGLDDEKLVAAAVAPITAPVPANFYYVSREDLTSFTPGAPHDGWVRVLGALAGKLEAWVARHEGSEEAAATRAKAEALRRAAAEIKAKLGPLGGFADRVFGGVEHPEQRAAPAQSPAAVAFAGIERTLSEDDYQAFEEVFQGTLEAWEARRRREKLARWAVVKRGDLTQLRAFEAGADFPALAEAVAAAVAEAARLERERRRKEAEAKRLKEEAAARSAAMAKQPAGTVFRDPLTGGGEGPEMCVIPAGRFLMGSPAREPGRDGNEGPQQEIRFAKPFALGRYAVTFDEYDAYCAATGAVQPGDEGWGRGRRPVIIVKWEDAQGYCAWLSAQSGAAYRLPAEAEWEYACRAGTVLPFWWGSSITTDQANYHGNFPYAGGARGVYRERTEPVDAFRPNPWGLYQMHGNVWEWCEDCWNDSLARQPVDGAARKYGDFSLSVLRGGSWYDGALGLRSANRYWNHRSNRSGNIGFRVARTLLE